MSDAPVIAETWRPVLGYEGHYEVSDHGHVRTSHHVVMKSNGAPMTIRVHQMTQGLSTHGYPIVHLSKNARTRTTSVHKLVLEAFVGPRLVGMECCHGDGNRTNNRLSNLRWGTSSENNYDIVRNGTHHWANKTHCPRGHLLEAPNLVRASLARGRRDCRACNQAKSYAKHYGIPFEPVADVKYDKLMRSAA